MAAYYNERDKDCAHWLRDLMKKGLIADGEVDTRSIRDVRAADVRGFTQAHFFAGIGLWSYALRLAGWPDDRPIWTGSCPCQPFSRAGKRQGFDDDRHLWPAWFPLIEERRPPVVMGEQVSGPDGLGWLDLVLADMEGCDYALGAMDLPVASLGAPNERQRLWWVADTAGGDAEPGRLQRGGEHGREPEDRHASDRPCSAERAAQDGRLADAGSGRCGDQRGIAGEQSGTGKRGDQPDAGGEGSRLGDAAAFGRQEQPRQEAALGTAMADREPDPGWLGDAEPQGLPDAGAPHLRGAGRRREGGEFKSPSGPRDPWRFLEWLECLDGRRRPWPAQLQVFPLAPRHPGDVARLRAAGNAISPILAAEVVRAYLDLNR